MSVIEVSVTPASLPGAGVTVHVAGELYAQAAPGFRAQVCDVLSDGAGPVHVDCSRLRFIDASGLGVFVYLANEAQRLGRPVFLHDVQPKVERVMHIARVDLLFENGLPPRPGA
jgi:anti-anti-sigma factor